MQSIPFQRFLNALLILVGSLALTTLVETVIPMRLRGFWAAFRMIIDWISRGLFGAWVLLAAPALALGLGLLMRRPAPARRAALLMLLGALPLALLCGSCAGRRADCEWRRLLPLVPEQMPLRETLREDVEVLANEIGPRNARSSHDSLSRAADFIEVRLQQAGYAVRRDTYQPRRTGSGPCSNLEAELRGTRRPGDILVVGAHYDTAPGTPGADDNASAVAILLALAQAFSGRPAGITVRFVAFANEEPPFFQTADMGSLVYAKGCANRGERIRSMLCLEMLGCYSEEPRTQRYPSRIFGCVFPTTGHFVGVIGNTQSSALASETASALRAGGVPALSAALPASVTGVAWSDHWSFWKTGVPAVMLTDTAHFRNPRYHTEADTPDTLDYDRMAALANVLERTIRKLAE